MKPKTIVVTGGPMSISDAVFTKLKAIQPNTIRVSGPDRYATGRAIVNYAFPTTSESAWVVTGAGFADAASASGAAAAAGIPVVLVNGADGTLDSAAKALLTRLKVSKTFIAGGTAVVSPGIQKDLAKLSTVLRLGGSDRYQTGQLINATAFGTTASSAILVNGYSYPDALAGTALAAVRNSPLYLVPGNCVPGATLDTILKSGAQTVTLVGGTARLTADVFALSRC